MTPRVAKISNAVVLVAGVGLLALPPVFLQQHVPAIDPAKANVISAATVTRSEPAQSAALPSAAKSLALLSAIQRCNANARAFDATKHPEHEAALALAPIYSATHIAVETGKWSDPATWADGQVPGKSSRVVIPYWTTVTYDRAPGSPSHEWVRVDGALVFAASKSTYLETATLLVGHGGRLDIGTPESPIAATVSAALVFAPREAAALALDKSDMAGGLISLGRVRINGREKAAFATSKSPLVPGTKTIRLTSPALNWSAGDRVVVPGVSLGQVEDEEFAIADISSDGLQITLNGALRYAHTGPENVAMPIANLTRNVRVGSLHKSPLAARGHIMFMHEQTGTEISGAAFADLGRTDTKVVHTLPRDQTVAAAIAPAGNTIGRYALHFHMKSGANAALAPHIVSGSVIEGSPKLGLVNHGGHVVAENNVGYNIAGSHFYAENGTEIGAFRGNIAIRSSGSADTIRAREFIGDNGHGGHGFWTQSSAVQMSDNWAFGHNASAYAVFGYPMREDGEYVYFDSRNLPDSDPLKGENKIAISNPSFHFTNNVAAAADMGLEVWVHHIYGAQESLSTVKKFAAWNIKTAGVFLPYSKGIAIDGLTLANFDSFGRGRGVLGNDMTEAVSIKNGSIHGFKDALVVPQRGHNRIENVAFNSRRTDIVVQPPTGPNRVIDIVEPRFAKSWFSRAKSLRLEAHKAPVNADVAMVFQDDRIYVSEGGVKKQLYFGEQRAGHVPLKHGGPAEMRGLTNAMLAQTFGLSVGGGAVANDAPVYPSSNALIGPVMAIPAAYRPIDKPYGGTYAESLDPQYPLASKHFAKGAEGGTPEQWSIARASENGQVRLTYHDDVSPQLVLTPTLYPMEIHPEDIRFGYRVEGMLYDGVGGRLAMRAFTQDFLNLAASPDGFVHVKFEVHDLAGNATAIDLPLKIAEKAVRRGANLSFFTQQQYCGACANDMQWAVAAGKVYAAAHSLIAEH